MTAKTATRDAIGSASTDWLAGEGAERDKAIIRGKQPEDSGSERYRKGGA